MEESLEGVPEKVRRILEPALLDARATAYEEGDPVRAAADLFQLAAESFWGHVGPDVERFMEGLPYLCRWIQEETGSYPPYSTLRWRAWALRNNAFKAAEAQKATKKRGRRGMSKVPGDKYRAVRIEANLSQTQMARTLGFKGVKRVQNAEKGLASKETQQKYQKKYPSLKMP